MRTIIVFILAAFTLSAGAQKTPLEKFVKKYAYEPGISVDVIEPASSEFPAFSEIDGPEAREVLAQFEYIRFIRCNAEETSPETRGLFYSKAMETLQEQRYRELINVNTPKDEIGFYASQEKNGVISEMALLIRETDDVMMIHARGEFKPGSIGMKELLSAMAKGKMNKGCDEDKPEAE